jgi:hypothetical protein
MVTRCPIRVQMRKPEGQKMHQARIGRPGKMAAATEVPGPGLDTNAHDLEEWGKKIRSCIETVQDQLVPKGQVTVEKITVELTGPCMPNLSLVDLPGLVNSGENPPLMKAIDELVVGEIKRQNCVIMTVSPATADKGTWAGRGCALRVDPQEHRAVGVITKVDLLYPSGGGAVSSQLRSWRKQVETELQRSTKTAFYAAYNPPDGEDISAETLGEIQQQFGDRVGNKNIARDLEKKLVKHLGTELPNMLEVFAARKESIEIELRKDVDPTWQSVEDLVLTYGRFVQNCKPVVYFVDSLLL